MAAVSHQCQASTWKVCCNSKIVTGVTAAAAITAVVLAILATSGVLSLGCGAPILYVVGSVLLLVPIYKVVQCVQQYWSTRQLVSQIQEIMLSDRSHPRVLPEVGSDGPGNPVNRVSTEASLRSVSDPQQSGTESSSEEMNVLTRTYHQVDPESTGLNSSEEGRSSSVVVVSSNGEGSTPLLPTPSDLVILTPLLDEQS